MIDGWFDWYVEAYNYKAAILVYYKNIQILRSVLPPEKKPMSSF